MVRPRYASTVVLVRPDDQGSFEILLTRRPQEMRFLGGYYVFPGGAVHASDYEPRILERCRGLAGEAALKSLGGSFNQQIALGHWVAVVRELFEEVGVLLCVTESGDGAMLNNEAAAQRIEEKRRALVNNRLDFGTFLESENLFCDLRRMAYFDHWVTPEIYSMRFDTRFFIAALPARQTALARSEEVTDSLWIGPAAALARIDRRDFPILPPTTTVLNDIAGFSSWDRLCADFNLGDGRP